MALRFNVGFTRWIPFLGYHHVLMIISLVAVTLLTILFAGCASGTSFSGVYLLSLSYSNATPVTNSAQLNQNLTGVFAGIVNGTVLEVRTGYLGLCISQPSGIWVCSNNAMALAEQIKSAGGSDPLNLVWMSAKFKDEAFFQGFIPFTLAIIAVAVLLLATFPGWSEETDADGSERQVKPFPSRAVSQAALSLFSMSSMLLLLTALWQHAVSGSLVTSLEATAYGAIKAHLGIIGIIFGWVGCVLVFVVVIGLLVMILSINVLRELTEMETADPGESTGENHLPPE